MPVARADMNVGWHHRIKKGPKMDITAATFFGGTGVEEFVGVAEAPDGDVVAYGNSWGPPFPTNVGTSVLGIDNPWPVPLHPAGAEKDADGNPQPPPENNPNRTGFMAFYSPDLRQLKRVLRFGWGVASITAAEVMSDRRVVVAGVGTRGFRPLAEAAKSLKTYPARRFSGYGPYEYGGVPQPGDVYVAQLTPDLKGLEWVWILEGHRVAPERIYEGPGRTAVFECRTLKSIAPDGQTMREVMKFFSSDRRFLLGVGPQDGSILIGGDYHHNTGREPWRKPVLDLYTAQGEPYARFYDWHGPLVGASWFRLVSDSAVRKGCFMPNGDILVYVWSDGGNTVATQNPVDLRQGVANAGIGMSMAGANVGSFCHLVRFNPKNYRDCSYTLWAAYLPHKPNSIIPNLLAGAPDGRVMIAGGAAGFLVQTTTRWSRATDHADVIRDANGKIHGWKLDERGWPRYLGIGGRGDFSAVFSPGFTNVLWSSCLANCQHAALRATARGIVGVSRCRGASANDGRKPFFETHDLADWLGFLRLLKKQGETDAPSAGRKLWPWLSEDLRKQASAFEREKDVTDEFKEDLFTELNQILAGRKDLYDAAVWQGGVFSDYERKLLTRLAAATIADEDLADLNRRLLEKAYPEHVYACPKSNRPPTLNAVQDEFGGGFWDGHLYLLEAVN
jgi:hypothetical protein